jgi:sporulation protein YlmC with PRC-barrel domain
MQAYQETAMTDTTANNTRDTLAADETDELISSEKVEGTAVYDRKGDKIGTVHHLMINKFTGQVAYAVISFGGFLGIGSEYRPLPWRLLDYNEATGGYVVDLDREQLENAPHFEENREPNWSDPAYTARIDEYWLIVP